MALDLPGGLFKQSDVRETESTTTITPETTTKYWSAVGSAFIAQSPDTDQVTKAINFATVRAGANGIFFVCPVNLPQGAVVTACTIYGNAGAAGETYILRRHLHNNGGITNMTTATNIGTEQTTISGATIDNELYNYSFDTTSLDTNDTIYGARITYII